MKMIGTVNKALLPVKAYYFFSSAAMASVIPYMPVFAKDMGLTTKEVSLIFGIAEALTIINNPIIGFITDKFRNFKFMMLLLMGCQVAFLFPLYYVPRLSFTTNSGLLICNDTYIYFDEKLISDINQCAIRKSDDVIQCSFNCNIIPLLMSWNITNNNSNLVNQQIHNTFATTEILMVRNFETLTIIDTQLNVSSELDYDLNIYLHSFCKKDKEIQCSLQYCANETCKGNDNLKSSPLTANFNFTYQFWIFFCFYVISSLAGFATNSLGDSVALLQLKDKPKHFGRQRLLASMGWGSFCMLIGFATDNYSKGKTHIDYIISFYSLAVMMTITALIILFFLSGIFPPKSSSISRDVIQVFKIPEVLLFAFMTCFSGMIHRFLSTFLFWHLKTLGSSQLNMGMCTLIMCISELPVFFFSGKIIEKLGHVWVTCIVFLAIALRMFCYSIISNSWFVLFVEPLHGIMFALWYANLTYFVQRVALPGTLATLQEIFGSCYAGIGGLLGSFLGGFIFSLLGNITTFQMFSIGAVLLCLLYGILQLIFKKCNWVIEPHHQKGDFPVLAVRFQQLPTANKE